MGVQGDPKTWAEQLDTLNGRTAKKLFDLSPNDVLVQISLPLILILAIATRLMIIGQTLAEQDKSPVILELWKQQLIQRIDRVLDRWEKDSGLLAFPDVGRIRWQGSWPEDEPFKKLCRRGQDLADIGRLKVRLYEAALRGAPGDASGVRGTAEVASLVLYDPKVDGAPPPSSEYAGEFVIDEGRRDYALRYVEERCMNWRSQVENLQWSVIERMARDLPLADPTTDPNPALQLKQMSRALEQRGYELLPSVRQEYRRGG